MFRFRTTNQSAEPDALMPPEFPMSKQQLIEAIQEHNRSVNDDFLKGFELGDLETYLQRLTRIANHRGRETGWVRSGAAPAVVTRHGRRKALAVA
jgi:hypothetical protein